MDWNLSTLLPETVRDRIARASAQMWSCLGASSVGILGGVGTASWSGSEGDQVARKDPLIGGHSNSDAGDAAVEAVRRDDPDGRLAVALFACFWAYMAWSARWNTSVSRSGWV